MTVRRPSNPVGGALSSVGLVGCVLLTGCSSGGDDGGAGSAASSSTAGAPTPAPTTAASPSAAPAYELPSSCAALLTLGQIDDALGSPLPGETTYTVGAAEPEIGRTGRITCGFGAAPATDTTGAGSPLLELSVFTYRDAAAAADRVATTVEAQQSRGARSEGAVVPGADAVLLTAADGATLVATVAARTYSLSMVPGVLDAASTPSVMAGLMGQVLAADGPLPTGSSAPRS